MHRFNEDSVGRYTATHLYIKCDKKTRYILNYFSINYRKKNLTAVCTSSRFDLLMLLLDEN